MTPDPDYWPLPTGTDGHLHKGGAMEDTVYEVRFPTGSAGQDVYLYTQSALEGAMLPGDLVDVTCPDGTIGHAVIVSRKIVEHGVEIVLQFPEAGAD